MQEYFKGIFFAISLINNIGGIGSPSAFVFCYLLLCVGKQCTGQKVKSLFRHSGPYGRPVILVSIVIIIVGLI